MPCTPSDRVPIDMSFLFTSAVPDSSIDVTGKRRLHVAILRKLGMAVQEVRAGSGTPSQYTDASGGVVLFSYRTCQLPACVLENPIRLDMQSSNT